MSKKPVVQLDAISKGVMDYVPTVLLVIISCICFFIYKHFKNITDTLSDKLDIFTESQTTHNTDTVDAVRSLLMTRQDNEAYKIPDVEDVSEEILANVSEDKLPKKEPKAKKTKKATVSINASSTDESVVETPNVTELLNTGD